MIKELFETFISANIVTAFSKNIANSYTVTIDLFLTKADEITLSKLVVPEHQRERGIGTAVMNDILTFADENKLSIVTKPSSVYGGDKNRLIKFYKRFSFVKKGATMIRTPKG